MKLNFEFNRLSKISKDRVNRLHEFKRIILNMPYTETYYVYKTNPGLLFEQEEYEIRSGK